LILKLTPETFDLTNEKGGLVVNGRIRARHGSTSAAVPLNRPRGCGSDVNENFQDIYEGHRRGTEDGSGLGMPGRPHPHIFGGPYYGPWGLVFQTKLKLPEQFIGNKLKLRVCDYALSGHLLYEYLVRGGCL
jgi:hypothetical protein